MKITIIHIAQCAGGVDTYLRMLMANMDSNKFRHILICSHDFDEKNYVGIADSIIQIDMCNAISLSKDTAAIKEVRKIIKDISPDIIYCHSSKAGGIGRLAAIGLNIPVIYNPHGWAFCMVGSKLKRIVYLTIEKILAHFTNKIVAISNYERLIAIQHRVEKIENIQTIFNGIDLKSIHYQLEHCNVSRESLGIPEDAYIVGMVGRISKQKAPDTFVRMASEIKQVIPEAWFMIVGDGDEKEDINSLIKSEGLDNCFTITGWVSNPLSYAYLFNQAVLLSRWEGFGLVLAEYMALSKPIIATATNAIPDLITNRVNGILVDVDNYKQAANAVYDIYKDKEMKNRFVDNGEMRVKAFYDISRTAIEHEDMIVKICKRGGVISDHIFLSVVCNKRNSSFSNIWRAAA